MNRGSRIADFSCFGSARSSECGMTLLEILIALGIVAAVAVIFLIGLTTSSRGVIVSQETVTADSLAKSQMEYTKSSPYDDANNPPVYGIDPDLDTPSGYSISVAAERLDPKGDGTDNDDGLQQITVTVTHEGEAAIIVSGYKVNR